MILLLHTFYCKNKYQASICFIPVCWEGGITGFCCSLVTGEGEYYHFVLSIYMNQVLLYSVIICLIFTLSHVNADSKN